MSLHRGRPGRRRRPSRAVAARRVVLPDDVVGVPGVWFWGNTAYDVRWHNDGLELRRWRAAALLKERFELVDGRAGRRARLPPRRAAGRRTTRGRVDPPPGVRDLRLHADALRPGGRRSRADIRRRTPVTRNGPARTSPER